MEKSSETRFASGERAEGAQLHGVGADGGDTSGSGRTGLGLVDKRLKRIEALLKYGVQEKESIRVLDRENGQAGS